MQYRNPKIITFLAFIIFIIGIFILLSGAFNTYENIGTQNQGGRDKPQEAGQSAVVQGLQGEQAFVTKVIDGDTITVVMSNKEYTVRFIGIDTPETKDPRRPVGCFGKEASNETKTLIENKVVILQKDVTDSDRYGRLLRYVYLPLNDGQLLFVNDYLVREGFAKVYTYPPDVRFNERFLQAQRQAQQNNKGLWGYCD